MTEQALISFIQKRLDRPLILIGMPAAGKTVLGAGLARILGFDFIDMDRQIEEEEGRRITEIFEIDGEAAFRDIEEKTLAGVIGRYIGPCVISTGGGAILRPANRALIFERACSIWVRASIPVLLERTAGDRNRRPLLKDRNPEQVLRGLETDRLPLYRDAEVMVDTDHRLPEQILPEILTKIHERLLS